MTWCAPLHYLGTWFLTLWTSRVFRHDARTAVIRGFRVEELRALLRAGGLDDYELEQHFLYRFLLDKETAGNAGGGGGREIWGCPLAAASGKRPHNSTYGEIDKREGPHGKPHHAFIIHHRWVM